MIAKPWPSCFRAIYSKDKHDYADEEAFEDGYYMTGDNALQNCDGTFQLLGRNDSIILMSTADRQIFMTHREQMSATVEDVASEIFPNQPCHRAVMVKIVIRTHIDMKLNKHTAYQVESEDGKNFFAAVQKPKKADEVRGDFKHC